MVPALSGSVGSAWALVSVVEALRCLWSGLPHHCEWMVSHTFQICLIVYLSSLFTSTGELQSAYCKTPSANEWHPSHGLLINGVCTVLCHGRGLYYRWDGEDKKNDRTESAGFFHVFTLKHQIKQKSLNHMCNVCTVIILTNRDLTATQSRPHMISGKTALLWLCHCFPMEIAGAPNSAERYPGRGAPLEIATERWKFK